MFLRNAGIHLQSTPHHNPEEQRRYLHRRENLKSHKLIVLSSLGR
jgi:hypothetical protein